MKKIKKRKGKLTNAKTGIAKFGYENYFYIKTVGAKSERRRNASFKFSESFKMPSKEKRLNKMEQEQIEKMTGKKVTAVIQEIDFTSKEYKEYEERMKELNE